MTLKNEMKNLETAIRSDPELRKYCQQESLILDITELIAKLMEEKNISYMRLAQALGVTRNYVVHFLEGGEITLRELADIFTALSSELVVDCKELK